MPLYEYRCPECGNSFEIIVPAPGARPACRSCGGNSPKRMLPVPAA